MRNPKRIPYILSMLQERWEKNPDIRFGQLVFNMLDGIWDTPESRFFYLEDYKLEQLLLGETIEVE